MIKFFRKTRQNLLNEGKTARYFKYAIGEIVLVVIGILIALQINNWNEERKNNSEQIKVLLNLKNQILNNQTILINVTESHQFVKNNINELLLIMGPNPSEIEDQEFDRMMYVMALMPVYKPSTSIIFSNQLEQITDDKLKGIIASWKNTYDDYIYGTKIIYDLYYNSIYEFMKNNYQMKNITSNSNFGRNGSLPTQRSQFSVDQLAILSSSTFENDVLMKKLNAENVLLNSTNLLKIQTDLLEYIDSILNTQPL